MAKDKITLEESILKDVPYDIPENWVWTNLEVIFENVTSSTKKLKQKEYKYEYREGYIEVIDQGEPFIGGYTNKKELAYEGKLPVIIFGDHSKCIKFIDFKFVQGADGVKVLLPKAINEKYLYYMMLNLKLPDKGYSRHYKFLREEPIPIAPLKEQQRIVDIIESLFEKLDKAKELIEEAREGFEKRKHAIMDKAFSGKLTEQWRGRNKFNLDSWIEKTLKETNIDIIDGDRGTNYPRKDEFTEIGYCLFLNAKNVTKDGFKFQEVNFITKEKDELLRKGKLERFDIILTTRGTIGNIAYFDESIPYDNIRINSGMVIYRNGEEFYKPFLCWLYKSNYIINQINNIKTGTAQPQLPIKIMKELKLIVPPLKEQKEIVRILDKLLDKEEKIEELTQLEEQIELIKKSILSKAFRGELGTNCEEDESALELLKEILKDK